MKYFGALEAGGTKMVLSILDETGAMLERVSIPTRTPDETMPEMINFFRAHTIEALGIGCFGPLDLNPRSKTYGYITATPKLDWRFYSLLPEFKKALNIPIGMDTDVNAAAMGEYRLGAAQGLEIVSYVTIGTGIGAGLIANGQPVHGLMHTEVGHMLLAPMANDPAPDGFCPYHKHCLEGLASGPAIEKRWGVSAKELAPDHPAWELETDYLAQMCHNLLTAVSPQKIILGGGVMQQEFLFPIIRRKTVELINGYIAVPAFENGLEDLIVPPGLGVNSGVMGSFIIAKEALAQA